MNVFSVIGLHHSGKTTAVENLITYIKSTGQSISSIKDIHQEGFTMEKQGSNSHRHLSASNTYVFARGVKETYLIWNRQLKLKEMLAHINTQWLIIEGMQEIAIPKIIAAKTTDEIDQLLDDTVFLITGIISENLDEYKGVPVINAISKINQLGELVLQKVFKVLPFANDGYCGHCGFSCYELTAEILKGKKTRADCGLKSSKHIIIKFNDETVVLNEWIQELSIDMVTAFCKNLKGYKQGDSITILIDNV